MMTERWRPVVGYEGLYEVSDQGRVRSLPRHATSGRVLKLSHRNGYARATLSAAGRVAYPAVHRLVAYAFHGEPAAGQVLVRHLNGSPSDNRAVNLAWGTHSDNATDKRGHGRDHNASKTHCLNDHEFTPENTGRSKYGRYCKACNRDRARAAYYRRQGRAVPSRK